MSAVIMDGKIAAAKVRADLANQVELLKAKGVVPGLGTI